MLSVLSFVGGNFALKKKIASNFIGDNVTGTKEEPPKKLKQQSSSTSSQEIMDEVDTPFLSVVEAAKFYRTIALVCRHWKRLMDASFATLATNIEVDFEEIEDKTTQVYGCILWLCQHHKTLNIGSIKTGSRVKATLYDLSLLIHLLQECHTENLTNYHVQMIGDSFSKFQSSGSPFVVSAVETSQRDLQEAIALNCPKLRFLGLSLVIQDYGGRDLPDILGQSLYLLPSITSLDITVEMFERYGTLDASVFSNLIGNLTALAHLSLRSNSMHFSEPVFHIRSTSLKQLDVDDFSKEATLSLDCPNLELFRCKGSFFGNSNDPQILLVYQKVVQAENIPTNCCASVVDVCDPHGPSTAIKFHDVLDPSVGFFPQGLPRGF